MSALLRVLIVDDDGVNRRVLRRLLSRFPEVEVLDAADGQAAWGMLDEAAPALILCDMQMPGMDGVTLIRQIRQQHATLAQVPIVVVSSSTDRDLVLQLRDLAVQDYLLKPYNLVQTFSRLERHLEPLLARCRAERVAAAVAAAAATAAAAKAAEAALFSPPAPPAVPIAPPAPADAEPAAGTETPGSSAA